MQAPFQPQHPIGFDRPSDTNGHYATDEVKSRGPRQTKVTDPEFASTGEIVKKFLRSLLGLDLETGRPLTYEKHEHQRPYSQGSVHVIDEGTLKAGHIGRGDSWALGPAGSSVGSDMTNTYHPKHVLAAMSDPDFKSKKDERARRRQARDDPRASAHHEHDDGSIGLHGFRHEHDPNMEAFHSDRWGDHHLDNHALIPSSSLERMNARPQHGKGPLPSNSPPHGLKGLHYSDRLDTRAISHAAPTSLMDGHHSLQAMDHIHCGPVSSNGGFLQHAPMLPSTHMLPDAHGHSHSITYSSTTQFLKKGKVVAGHQQLAHQVVQPHADGKGHTITTSHIISSSSSSHSQNRH